MRRNEGLLVATIIVFIIGVSAISWSEKNEPKHAEVTARIVEKDYLRGRGIFERTLFVFWLDNGDSIGVSQVDYLDYEIGDTYTYCTCQVIRL